MPKEDPRNDSETQALLDNVHRELRTTFMASMPGRLDEIRRIAKAMSDGRPDPRVVRDLHAETHRLAGTSAVYGLAHTSDVTRRFNRMLLDRMEAGTAAVSLDLLESFLFELNAALQQDQ